MSRRRSSLSARRRRRVRRRLLPLLVLVLALGGGVALGATGMVQPASWLPEPSDQPAAPRVAPAAIGAPPEPPRVPAGAVLPDTPIQEALPPLDVLPQPVVPEMDFDAPAPVRVRRAQPRSGLMVDLDTGAVLWRRVPRRKLPIASLTKIMTALVAAETLAADDRVTIPVAAGRITGSRMGGLVAGRNVPTEALLHGLMISSGNDAAVALAIGAAGTQRAFVARMNARARRWGLRCTRFANPHGLGLGNVSCPADLARLAVRAMAVPRIAAIAAKRDERVWLGRGRARPLLSTNPLLRGGTPGVLGLKTGYTRAAGRCLVAVVRQDGARRAIVLLDDPDPGLTARRLMRAAARL